MLEVAAQSPHRFTDGVAIIDLAPLDDRALVLTTVARALGVQRGVDVPQQALVDSKNFHTVICLS